MKPESIGYYFSSKEAGIPFALPDALDLEKILSSAAKYLKEMPSGPWMGYIGQGVSIQGAVFIGAGSEIQSGAQIEGPVWIGEGAQIGHGALLRAGTIVGQECVVGHGAEIKNSILMAKAKAQSQSFVGDSALGQGARIGSGSVLANRRFDQERISQWTAGEKQSSSLHFLGSLLGDYCRLGANCTAYPGTALGPFCKVMPGAVVRGFIPRSSDVRMEQKMVISPGSEQTLK